MSSSLFLRKPLDSTATEASADAAVARPMGKAALISLGVGGVTGSGIFILTGVGAHQTAGPALIISFILAGIACLASALCYAEFAARVPVAGSAYTYAYVTLGEMFAWIVGWNLLLEYGLAAASVAQGWSHYFQSFLGSLGVQLPASLTQAPLDLNPMTGKWVATGALFDLPALSILVVITLIVVRNIRVGLAFNIAMLIVKVAALLFVLVVGAFYIHPSNWHPFAPYGWGGLSILGKSLFGPTSTSGEPVGVLAGAALVFYAYLGFEAITAYTEETRDPKRDIPQAMIAVMLICTALYIAVTVVLTGMVPYSQIDLHAPLSEAFRQVGLPWAQFLIALGATTGITSVVLIIMMSYPRILVAIGRDNLIPRSFFTALHPRYDTPWKATLLVGGITSLLAALLPLRVLTDLVILGTLFGFILVSIAVLVLRRSKGPEDAFRAPLGPLMPLISIGSCLMLMLALPVASWIRLSGWLVAGLLIYFTYGRRHSALKHS